MKSYQFGMLMQATGFKGSKFFHIATLLSLIGLIILCVAWELWWAPLRDGGTLMALKAVPLLFALKGISQGRVYTFQWLAMLSLLYLMEGIVRAWSDLSNVSVYLAIVEIVLATILYISSILYVRPAKQAARKKHK